MHQTQTLIGLVAAVLEVIQAIPYYIGIFKGYTKPHRTSFGIWLAVEAIGTTSYIASGATTTKWVPIVAVFNALCIFALSIKHGMGGLSKLDIICSVLAAAVIVLWAATDNPVLAVYLSTFAGCLAYLPTIRKAYIWPRTESTLSWVIFAAAGGLNVLALTSGRLVIIVLPVTTFIFSAIVAGLLMFPRWQLSGHKRFHRLPKAKEV